MTGVLYGGVQEIWLRTYIIITTDVSLVPPRALSLTTFIRDTLMKNSAYAPTERLLGRLASNRVQFGVIENPTVNVVRNWILFHNN